MLRALLIFAVGFWSVESRADDRFYVAAQINGKPVTLIFDTGATISVLWSNSAVRLGLTNFQGGDVMSSATSEPCTVSIGASSTRMYFHIKELPPWATNMVDGMLGWMTFKNNILQFNAESHRLTVLDKLPAVVRTWSRLQVNRDLYVQGLEVGAGKQSPADLLIDTGDEGGVGLSVAAWRKWRAENPGQPVTLQGNYSPFHGYESLQVSWTGSMAFGGVRLTEVPVSEAPSGCEFISSNFVAVLGMTALKRLDVIVDASKGFAYFHAKLTPPAYFKHNGLGTVFLPGESTSGPLQAHVLTNSPGWEAGIRNGDELLKEDGEDATDWYTNRPAGNELPVGTKLVYTLRRGTNIFEVSTVTRRILNCPGLEAVEPTNSPATNQSVTNFFEGQAVRLNSNASDEYFRRGSRYWEAGDFDRAIADFSEAIRLNPKDGYAYGNRGTLYVKEGHPDQAIADLTMAMRYGLRSGEVYFYRAFAYKVKSEFSRALADLDEAVRLEPTNLNYRSLRGNCHLAAGMPLLAILDCNQLIHLAPSDPQAFFSRGYVYLAITNLDNAISDFDEAVRLGGTNEAVSGFLAQAYSLKGEFSNAVGDFNRAISLNPTNAMSFFWRGTCYSRLSQSELAIRDYNEAIRLNPTNALTYEWRAHAHQQESDIPAALNDLMEALRLNPKSVWAHQSRARVYILQGRPDAAVADFHEAARLNPQDSDSVQGAAWLEAACTNAAVRNGARAIKDATRACVLTNWKEADTLDTLAAAYAEAGNFKRAIELDKQAVGLTEPGDFDVRRRFREHIDLYEKSQPLRDTR